MKYIFYILSALALFAIILPWGVIYYSAITEKILHKKHARDLHRKIRWLATQDNLSKYIFREQKALNVDDEYCVDFSNPAELEFIDKTLDIHKNKTIDAFFSESLIEDKLFYNLNFLEYYMFSLYGFLERNCYRSPLGFFLENYTYKCKNDFGNSIYSLTEQGVIYTKLRHIVTLYCVKNENTKKLFTSPKDALDDIKKLLYKKEFVV